MIRLIRKATPEFKLNICWQNLRLCDHFSYRLKMHTPFLQKSGVVYKMKCVKNCSQEYIGESQRPVRARLLEHNRLKSSAVENHIKNCSYYQNELKKQYGMSPTSTEKRNFHLSLYEPIVTNASNYSRRKRLEAISIVLFDPQLNNQVKHKKIHLISPL